MKRLETMLEQYRNGERGLPTYAELVALTHPEESKVAGFPALPASPPYPQPEGQDD